MTEAIKQKEKSPLTWVPLIFILVGLIIFITFQQKEMNKRVELPAEISAIDAQKSLADSGEFPMKLWLTVIGGILILLTGKELYFALTSGNTEIQWITPTMLAIGLSLLTVIIIMLEKYYPGWWSNLWNCKNGKLQLGALAVLFLAYYIMPGTGPTTISIGKIFIPIGIIIIIMMIAITATGWKFETKKGSAAVPVAQSQLSWSDTLPMDEKIDTGLAVKNFGSFLITADKDVYLVQGDGNWGDEHSVLIKGPIKNMRRTYSIGGGIWVKAKYPGTKVEIKTL